MTKKSNALAKLPKLRSRHTAVPAELTLRSFIGRGMAAQAAVDALLSDDAARIRLIAAAEAGDHAADAALRNLAIEHLSVGAAMPTELAAYVQRALLK